MHTLIWLVKLNGRDHLEDRGVDGWKMLKGILNKQSGNVWIGFIWLRKGTTGGLLRTQQWTFGFHKRRGISWLSEWLLACQGGHCWMELVCFSQ